MLLTGTALETNSSDVRNVSGERWDDTAGKRVAAREGDAPAQTAVETSDWVNCLTYRHRSCAPLGLEEIARDQPG